jgi:TRAP-type C4-dicarboxylate transport system permease small subunit
MTVGIIASRGLGRDIQSHALPIVVLGQPHSRRAAASPIEPLLAVLSLILFSRLRGRGRHAETRATTSPQGPLRRFLKEWWPYLAVLVGFALVTIFGLLVLSVQVPR